MRKRRLKRWGSRGVTWIIPSSIERRAAIAWILDRREQYQPESGIVQALTEIIVGLSRGDDIDAYEHGELDDLLESDGYPKNARAAGRKG